MLQMYAYTHPIFPIEKSADVDTVPRSLLFDTDLTGKGDIAGRFPDLHLALGRIGVSVRSGMDAVAFRGLPFRPKGIRRKAKKEKNGKAKNRTACLPMHVELHRAAGLPTDPSRKRSRSSPQKAICIPRPEVHPPASGTPPHTDAKDLGKTRDGENSRFFSIKMSTDHHKSQFFDDAGKFRNLHPGILLRGKAPRGSRLRSASWEAGSSPHLRNLWHLLCIIRQCG